MNQEEQVQVYMDGLQERAKSLTGVQLELAGYVVEIAGSTYLRGDEKMFLNTDKLLGRLGAETQKPLFEPLLDVLSIWRASHWLHDSVISHSVRLVSHTVTTMNAALSAHPIRAACRTSHP